MTDAKGESIERQRKWYAKNVNTFLDMIMDIIYADEEMIVILESSFMAVVIKGKGRCYQMTIKEAVEYLRKEKGCRTLDANICFSKSCDKCEYLVSHDAFIMALDVILAELDYDAYVMVLDFILEATLE